MQKMTELRKRAGLTQAETAAIMGMNRSSIAKWETGVAQPRADKLMMLARLYGCTIDDLFQKAENRTS